MATGNLGMKLNLLELALKLKNAAYNPKVLARDDVLD
jgi:TATA-box binding protein (TBP) (component of TFIID and TFIIIB)